MADDNSDSNVLETQWWLIDLPEEWSAEQEEDSVIISDSDGVGDIIITTLIKNDGAVTAADLSDLASDVSAEFGPGKPVRVGVLSGEYYSFEEDGEYVREWYLGADKVILLVTYCCDQDNARMDDAAVDEILDTLHLLEPADGHQA